MRETTYFYILPEAVNITYKSLTDRAALARVKRRLNTARGKS